jgi:hypothetical protein
MNTLTISRKHNLLERAEMFHHTQIFVPDAKSYVRGVLHEPIAFKEYQSSTEPVVDPTDLYELDDSACSAWLTVNRYNALVLNTSNMLIADIDFGDERLNRFAGAEDCDEVVENLKELQVFDEEFMRFEDFRFADQSYRVYRTHSGCRVICTSICVLWADMGWLAQRFMRFLRSDPAYIELCGVQRCYRARLTPKPWREKGGPCHVARLVDVHGDEVVCPELEEQLRLHDELTLPEKDSSDFA